MDLLGVVALLADIPAPSPQTLLFKLARRRFIARDYLEPAQRYFVAIVLCRRACSNLHGLCNGGIRINAPNKHSNPASS